MNEYDLRPSFPPIDEVDIRDDIMFAYVIRKPDICVELLRVLLPGMPIGHVEYYELNEKGQEVPQRPSANHDARVETQKAMAEAFSKRGVRLDAYLDDGKTIYNIEMQTTQMAALPQRARLYQAHLDINQLERGQHYDELRPSYVIFICTFDPFGQGRYCYSFRNRCEEEPELALNDGAHKLFFSTVGPKGEISDELREVLAYINNPKTAGAPGARLPLIEKMEQAVGEAKMDDEWRRNYMTYQVHQRDAEIKGITKGIAIGETRGIQKGRQLGRQEGRQEGVNQTAWKLLNLGTPESVITAATGLTSRELDELRKNPPAMQ